MRSLQLNWYINSFYSKAQMVHTILKPNQFVRFSAFDHRPRRETKNTHTQNWHKNSRNWTAWRWFDIGMIARLVPQATFIADRNTCEEHEWQNKDILFLFYYFSCRHWRYLIFICFICSCVCLPFRHCAIAINSCATKVMSRIIFRQCVCVCARALAKPKTIKSDDQSSYFCGRRANNYRSQDVRV